MDYRKSNTAELSLKSLLTLLKVQLILHNTSTPVQVTYH